MSEFEPKPKDLAQAPVEGKEKFNIKVLLVDDDKGLREITAMFLKMMGCIVEEAEDGEEFIKRLKNSEPSEFGLVITDKDMPKMNGIEAIREVRKEDRFRKLPIILYSGNIAEVEETVQQDLGIKLLGKPFKPDELKTAVREALIESPK